MIVNIVLWDQPAGHARHGWAEVLDGSPDPELFQFLYFIRTGEFFCRNEEQAMPVVEIEEAVYRAVKLRIDMEQMQGEEYDSTGRDSDASESDPASRDEASQTRQTQQPIEEDKQSPA